MRPAPTSYNIPSPGNQNNTVFSKEERKSLVEKECLLHPGPAKYDTQLRKTQKDEYSFKRSGKMADKDELLPGPGTYELGKNRHKMKSYKFNQAMKIIKDRERTPGPGYYDG